LVGCTRLAIDTDEIVAGLASNTLFDKLAYGCAILNFNVVGEAASVIVDEQNLHFESFLFVKKMVCLIGAKDAVLPERPPASSHFGGFTVH
jgi:hypothetical protein